MQHTVKGFRDTINWYDANASTYAANLEQHPSSPMIGTFIERLTRGARVLDAGCASGRDTRTLRDAGLMPTGVDLSAKLLDLARARSPEIPYIQADFKSLPFEDGILDGIWAHASLLHLETTDEVLQALREFARVLVRGGLLFVFVKQQLGEAKTEVVADKLSGGHDRFFQWFRKDELAHLLTQAGYRIDTIADEVPDPTGRDDVRWIQALAYKG